MAKITACDLCNTPIEPNSLGDELSIVLSINKQETRITDLHRACFDEIKQMLTFEANRPARPLNALGTEESKATKKEEVVKDAKSPKRGKKPKAAPPIQTKDEDAEPTEELLEIEMAKIPSRFDRKEAAKQHRKLFGSCQHPFKSYTDEGVFCVGPPEGYEGSFVKNKPCGKKLTQKELV